MTADHAPEFSRPFDLRQIGNHPVEIVASAEERAALAKRFGVVSIGKLSASLTLIPDGEAVAVTGRLEAAIVQSCAVSGDDLPSTIDEPISVRFVPENHAKPAELELEAAELDEIEYTGTAFDLGEAVAQSLALAIDPYVVGPNAEAAREEAGLGKPDLSGPFAALAALKKS